MCSLSGITGGGLVWSVGGGTGMVAPETREWFSGAGTCAVSGGLFSKEPGAGGTTESPGACSAPPAKVGVVGVVTVVSIAARVVFW